MANLSTPLQENLLTLLVFDQENCQLIRDTVSIEMYDFVLQPIARRAHEYIDRYNKPPQEHISDLLETELQDEQKEEDLEQVLQSMYELSQNINPDFVLDKLYTFHRRQGLRRGLLEAADILQSNPEDDDSALDRAEEVLRENTKARVKIFDPGLSLYDVRKVEEYLERRDSSLAIGIDEFDRRGIKPSKGSLMILAALSGRGKSQFMVHVGKTNLLRRAKVCHITLEMSAEQVLQRYYQSMFAVSKRDIPLQVSTIVKNNEGVVEDLAFHDIKPKSSFDSETVWDYLEDRSSRFHGGKRLVVKQFPPGELTVEGLKSYLDMLEQFHSFIPDVILLDYVDDMAINASNFRIELGRTTKGLRGIGVERDIAMITASQMNRDSFQKKVITEAGVSEDFSKVMTSDIFLSYNQTEMEKALGLARIYAAKVRDDQSGYIVLLSQNYDLAQFVVDSSLMEKNSYWSLIEGLEEEEDGNQ